jgi:hypothetical protein
MANEMGASFREGEEGEVEVKLVGLIIGKGL